MSTFLPHTILDNTFLLSTNRTIFWEEEKALILSDLHLGKSGHFRKAGIAIPQTVLQEDLFRLLSAIQFFKPAKLIIVGDLFHSHANKEHELFYKWRQDIPNTEVHLVMGNHDILHEDWYKKAGIILHHQKMIVNNFVFAHDINDVEKNDEYYYFSGHIHPSVLMHGVARQSVKLPCFYFTKMYAVLPAFGKFTGTFSITPKKEDAVYALVENSLVKLK
jgi:uncharacterized protein